MVTPTTSPGLGWSPGNIEQHVGARAERGDEVRGVMSHHGWAVVDTPPAPLIDAIRTGYCRQQVELKPYLHMGF